MVTQPTPSRPHPDHTVAGFWGAGQSGGKEDDDDQNYP